MNVIGIGIDLVDIPAFEEKLARAAFREQLFTPAEQAQAESRRHPVQTYAGKFAVKEAVMKALGAGIRQSVWFTAIEVLDAESGAPAVVLHRAARDRAAALQITGWHISISHIPQAAVAVALALGPDQPEATPSGA